MNKNEDLILGFPNLLKKSKKFKINPENFPTKIGGSPVWLIPDKIPKILCNECSNPMKFLLQIYAPLEIESCYHRVIYIFFCPCSKCNRKRESIKVFRAQLPFINELYSFQDKATTELYKTLSKTDKPEVFTFLNKEYLIKTEIIDKSEVQTQFFLSEERIKELQNKYTDPEYEEFEASRLKENNLKHEKQLYEDFVSNNQKEECDENMEDFFKNEKIDQDYEKYKFLLELYRNEEIMRYSRGKETLPMWYSENNKWSPKDIRKCERCGGNRIFELQINSTFLNLYQELIELDWGIVAIYTCEKSCQGDGNYAEEVAFIQFSNDELQMEGMKFKELAEIPEEKENEIYNCPENLKNKENNQKNEISKDNKNEKNIKEEEKKIENDEDDWE